MSGSRPITATYRLIVVKFQKLSAENSKQLRKIENFGRKFKSSAERWAVPPKIRNGSGRIEKLRGKINFVAENLKLPGKIQIGGWRANGSGEDLNCRATI
jgi:hypothetical protein